MIRIQQLKLPMPHNEEQLLRSIQKILRLKEPVFSYEIVRKSLDARKKPVIYSVYTIDVTLTQKSMTEKKVLQGCKSRQVSHIEKKPYTFPEAGEEELKNSPIVIGTGPAGLFCGLMLARHGYKPILLERGESVDIRQKDVENFWNGGELKKNSNVQFGEGGAGTFSDGKLNTLVKDSSGRNRKVLEEFVHAGAKKSVLYENKPHIGTDVLRNIVRTMRNEIISLGGTVRFGAQVTDFRVEEDDKKNRRLTAVCVNGKEWIPATVAVLAIGHSARDTFETLYNRNVPMQAKAFAVGVRMEHPQKMINLSQFGMETAQYLEAADYKLTAKAGNGRGVYSFCMCPGGYVVNASSEPGRTAINGMSYSDRGGKNANSAIIVTVMPEDFSGEIKKEAAKRNPRELETDSRELEADSREYPLVGMEFQRILEERAYAAGKGKIPVQCYQDFKQNRASTKLGEIKPQMRGNYELSNVRNIFPEYISEAIIDGVEQFDKKIKGFSREDALVSGVESRTSSPVRIVRDENMESEIKGLYPCGEGAGYAGGITSAGMDGIKVAEAIAKRYKLM